MLKKIGTLLKNRASHRHIVESDIRHLVEQFFIRELRDDHVYCRYVKRGIIVVQTFSPLLRQEAYLLSYDLALFLKEEANYTLKKLKVIS